MKVSIVLPTRNGARYIRQAIESCLSQTHQDIELMIVDDGSTDETPQIIGSYRDERIKYLRHEKNKGLPAALNTGFSYSSGDYLTWISDDNLFARDAVERMLAFLGSKQCSFVYCDYYKFRDDDISRTALFRTPRRVDPKKIGPCFLYARQVKEVVGDYDPEAFLAEDYDYWIRVSKKFIMCHLNEPLYFYREHAGQLYSSRYCDVKATEFLVRIRHDVSSVEQTKNMVLSLLARESKGLFILNIIRARKRFSNRISAILTDFKRGKIDFAGAKAELRKIF